MAKRRANMAKREVAVGDFRQRATELVRQVEETKQAITITRRGVPVAELRAVTADPEALLGSVTYLDPDLTRPVVGPEDWEAAS
jgi:prevent-host-death family protein